MALTLGTFSLGAKLALEAIFVVRDLAKSDPKSSKKFDLDKNPSV